MCRSIIDVNESKNEGQFSMVPSNVGSRNSGNLLETESVSLSLVKDWFVDVDCQTRVCYRVVVSHVNVPKSNVSLLLRHLRVLVLLVVLVRPVSRPAAPIGCHANLDFDRIIRIGFVCFVHEFYKGILLPSECPSFSSQGDVIHQLGGRRIRSSRFDWHDDGVIRSKELSHTTLAIIITFYTSSNMNDLFTLSYA